ncbi:Alpha/Beta hydrolase protein [Suillus discolor]|uniref:Alpha/Beta hydrolase protein n=1 Tax=Suillus discolor TaxID=1912936 RepID=A0A9P7JNT7_9AGAM|nr:Alpha/Beta hydrolase protein [Suillus discolor]KAG2093719.1 Alpha/Beta hydrolase protein [Suillus discolor]
MSSIGPQIPAHFLPTVASAEDSEEDNDYTPALPPDLTASCAAGPSLPSKSESNVAPPKHQYVGPSLPGSQAPYDDDSDSDVGPQPLPAIYASRIEEKLGVEEFLEREERRRKLQEEASKPKKLQREEWMLVSPKSGDLLACSYVEIKDESFDFVVVNNVCRLSDYTFVFTGLQSNAPGAAMLCTLTGPSFVPNFQVLRSTASASAAPFPEGIISLPTPLEFKVAGDKTVYAVYYAPNNPAYGGSSIPNEKPPCVLSVHGGPTGLETQHLNWLKQYFTSRGYACGSSCYGRAYVERLQGNWGITDVSDCVGAIQSPQISSLIDTKRTAIRGGSAGGFTTLAAISLDSSAASKVKFFASATNSYGVSNMELFAEDTHKFELMYIIKLLGGTREEIPKVWHDRSPVYFSANIKTPLLVLQGNDDAVAPPSQSWTIIDEIIKSKGHVEAHFFDGEQHGWRTSGTLKKAIEFEREWYEKSMVRPAVAT